MAHTLLDLVTDKIYEIPGNIPIIIGRDNSCDVQISEYSELSEYVSRTHCIIEYNGNAFVIDKSKNGTYVNGQKIESKTGIALKSGDILSLGPYRFKFLENELNTTKTL